MANPYVELMSRASSRARGFTLVELLVAMVVLGIMGMGMVKLFIAQHQAYMMQNEGVLATQNARAGFDMMTREIRNAGYDPRGIAGAGITHWTVDSFGWTADLNADGDVADDAEAVLYFFQADPGALIRREEGTDITVTDGVIGLTLEYSSDANGTVAGSADQVEQVGITMTYDTPDGVLPGALETHVALRNNIYE